jgi:type III secretory pathway lipoprotein EscJ
MTNHKLTKKLQVLLTEDEMSQVNRVILNEALENEQRPVSVSAWIRQLIQAELSKQHIEQKSFIKQTVKNLNKK